jgi:hypothetical protein
MFLIAKRGAGMTATLRERLKTPKPLFGTFIKTPTHHGMEIAALAGSGFHANQQYLLGMLVPTMIGALLGPACCAGNRHGRFRFVLGQSGTP